MEKLVIHRTYVLLHLEMLQPWAPEIYWNLAWTRFHESFGSADSPLQMLGWKFAGEQFPANSCSVCVFFCFVDHLKLGGGFKYCLFSPRKLGKIPILTHMFSNGLVQPLEKVGRAENGGMPLGPGAFNVGRIFSLTIDGLDLSLESLAHQSYEASEMIGGNGVSSWPVVCVRLVYIARSFTRSYMMLIFHRWQERQEVQELFSENVGFDIVTCFIFVGVDSSSWEFVKWTNKTLLQVGCVDREISWNWTQWWGLIFIHIVIFSWFGNQVLQPWYGMIRLETVHCSGGSSRCCSIRQYRPVQPSVDTAGICRLVGLMFLRKIYPPPWTDLSGRDKQFCIGTPSNQGKYDIL